MLVNGIMVPITGFLIDRFSTRKLFFASMAAFIVGTALCAAAPSFELLIVGRILQAAGAGVQLPLVGVVPMLIFPPEKRGTAMGMAGIVMSCAPAAGPVLAGGIIDAWGWRMMFWSMIPLAVLVLAVSFFLLSNVGELKRPHLDVPSIVLSTFAFGGLLYGFSSASTLGWGNAVVVGSIAVGVVSLAWFVRRQLHLDEPLLQLRALKTPTFAYSAVIVTVVNSALAVGSVILPIYLQNVLGLTAFETGILMTPGAVSTIFQMCIRDSLFPGALLAEQHVEQVARDGGAPHHADEPAVLVDDRHLLELLLRQHVGDLADGLVGRDAQHLLHGQLHHVAVLERAGLLLEGLVVVQHLSLIHI